jgi:hypothetical protein
MAIRPAGGWPPTERRVVEYGGLCTSPCGPHMKYGSDKDSSFLTIQLWAKQSKLITDQNKYGNFEITYNLSFVGTYFPSVRMWTTDARTI